MSHTKDKSAGLVQVALENIDGGNCVTYVNKVIERVCDDVVNRCRVKKPRKVILELELTPGIAGEGSEHERVGAAIAWKTKWAVPGASGATTMAMIHDGKVLVNPESLDALQMTLDLSEQRPSNVVAMGEKS